uniref:Diphthine methyl ester synthase n=1 Tax=Glossina austeni TaxID=7395 RepID=A0A1A9UNS7_GLOAU
MFYLVGLGLVDPMNISVKGLEIVKRCSRVYLESYTSILGCHKGKLETYYGRPLLLANRDVVEEKTDEILTGAYNSVQKHCNIKCSCLLHCKYTYTYLHLLTLTYTLMMREENEAEVHSTSNQTKMIILASSVTGDGIHELFVNQFNEFQERDSG